MIRTSYSVEFNYLATYLASSGLIQGVKILVHKEFLCYSHISYVCMHLDMYKLTSMSILTY